MSLNPDLANSAILATGLVCLLNTGITGSPPGPSGFVLGNLNSGPQDCIVNAILFLSHLPLVSGFRFSVQCLSGAKVSAMRDEVLQDCIRLPLHLVMPAVTSKH